MTHVKNRGYVHTVVPANDKVAISQSASNDDTQGVLTVEKPYSSSDREVYVNRDYVEATLDSCNSVLKAYRQGQDLGLTIETLECMYEMLYHKSTPV